ncbi:hypothetical protein [Streptomyces sp. NPDC017949]|uniref:hypothetical protein n=1 Tax=Streptomyces sp. NPDC017949 TaxID=3365020 RepID=UPI0037B5F586
MPDNARIVIPVMGAGGGSGRSVLAGMLAACLTPAADTVVLDIAPRLASPWPAWQIEPGAGLASLPPTERTTPARIRAAASRCEGPDGDWQVLTDQRDWSTPPLDLPTAPAAWYQLAAAGGWQAIVADTTHPVAHDIVAARSDHRTSLTAQWCALPYAVPVLTAAATGPGVAALQMALRAATAEGLPVRRAVVTLVSLGEGRLAAPVRAAATMLQGQVHSVVHIPYDPHVRAYGLADARRLTARRTREALAELAGAVIASTRDTWGHPLPAAPVPAAAPRPGALPAAAFPVLASAL